MEREFYDITLKNTLDSKKCYIFDLKKIKSIGGARNFSK